MLKNYVLARTDSIFYPPGKQLKSMKTRFWSLSQVSTGLVALSFMIVVSCKGPEGPQGPAGPTGAPGVAGTPGVAGATGPAGVSGVAGAMGNANVVYTAWKGVDISSSYYQTTDNLYTYMGNDNASAYPLLTNDVINKSLVYVYFKFGQQFYDNATAEVKLVERIAPTSAYGQIKIPGRTTSTYTDFFNYQVYHQPIGPNFLNFTLRMDTFTYDQQGKQLVIPELVGKNAQYFRDLVKDLPQYRVVIVNGSTPGGRAAAIDYKDYAAVKKAYNLPN